jgi:hypothetical protein
LAFRAGRSADGFVDLGGELAVSTDGTTLLVAAPFAGGTQRGAAYVFRASNENAWASSSAPAATLTASGGHAYDNLGAGVGLSADGTTVLGGALGARWGTGEADVFHVSDASSWVSSANPTATLTDSALAACVVPKLTGLTVHAAKSALAAASCRLGKVKRVHAKGKKGRIVSQSRPRGSRLAVGAKVSVKVGK